MKKVLLGLLTLAAVYSPNDAEALTWEINVPKRRMVTINNAVSCPSAEVDKCKITVSITELGGISVTVSGDMSVPVDNVSGSTDPQQVAEITAGILEADGSIPMSPVAP